MPFVYLHIVWFVAWIGFRVESYPFGLLTMIVSLEAIFLSTFVMISQNRADAKRESLAEHQWQIVQAEEKQNEELLEVSKQILDLTKQIHQMSGLEALDRPERRSGCATLPAARGTGAALSVLLSGAGCRSPARSDPPRARAPTRIPSSNRARHDRCVPRLSR